MVAAHDPVQLEYRLCRCPNRIKDRPNRRDMRRLPPCSRLERRRQCWMYWNVASHRLDWRTGSGPETLLMKGVFAARSRPIYEVSTLCVIESVDMLKHTCCGVYRHAGSHTLKSSLKPAEQPLASRTSQRDCCTLLPFPFYRYH